MSNFLKSKYQNKYFSFPNIKINISNFVNLSLLREIFAVFHLYTHQNNQ